MLVVRGVEKHFGATHALTGVDLTVAAGEVHAVLGENGAGKSTLMNVLCGAFPADAGIVTLGGARYAPADPDAAFRAGVAIVHQELSLCPHLTVEENLLLGDESTRAGFLDRRRLRERAAAALARVGSTTRSTRGPSICRPRRSSWSRSRGRWCAVSRGC